MSKKSPISQVEFKCKQEKFNKWISSSLAGILRLSLNSDFRSKCFNLVKVDNTNDLEKSVNRTLNNLSHTGNYSGDDQFDKLCPSGEDVKRQNEEVNLIESRSSVNNLNINVKTTNDSQQAKNTTVSGLTLKRKSDISINVINKHSAKRMGGIPVAVDTICKISNEQSAKENPSLVNNDVGNEELVLTIQENDTQPNNEEKWLGIEDIIDDVVWD